MVSSIRQTIACTLLILGLAVSTHSQTTPAKESTASISGKVTFKGKAISGIVVTAILERSGRPPKSRDRGTTDHDGNYRITNLPPGTYQVRPVAPALVVEDEQPHKSVMISEGEAVENINFPLVRGGVVTGRVTDPEGQPLVEQYVHLIPVDARSGYAPVLEMYPTDDRGIYRLFGLREGKYTVSVGHGDRQLPGEAYQLYKQTFHPSVTDPARATIIEVTEGGETKNVDIVLGRLANTFKVSGRIIDGETGKPIPNIMYGVSQRTSEGGSSTSGPTSNQNGEFISQYSQENIRSLLFRRKPATSARRPYLSKWWIGTSVTY